MARRRVLASNDGGGWAIAPPGREEELDSLSRKLAAAVDGAVRFGGRLAMRLEGYPRRFLDGRKDDEGKDGEGGEASGEATGAEAASERATKTGETEPAKASETGNEASAEAGPIPLDPERASRLEQALRNTWTLARCDQRLTQRLGLL